MCATQSNIANDKSAAQGGSAIFKKMSLEIYMYTISS